MLAAPSSAVALSVGQADAQAPVELDLGSDQVAYGGAVHVRGTVPAASVGERALLQFARAGSSDWRSLSAATIRAGGRFTLSAPLRQTGLIRVITASGGGSRSATPTATAASSDARPVSVRPSFRVAHRSIDVLAGAAAHVRGTLLPGLPGRRVRLLEQRHGQWRVIGSDRTGGRGGFDIRYHSPNSTSSAAGHRLRVLFGGDRYNTARSAPVGRVRVFSESVASWYDDSGSTACGFHAGLGVANKDLPCGTKVSFRFGGRTVTATVDDRGPFVGGRTWDLNQNTAGALGFGGVATVWATS